MDYQDDHYFDEWDEKQRENIIYQENKEFFDNRKNGLKLQKKRMTIVAVISLSALLTIGGVVGYSQRKSYDEAHEVVAEAMVPDEITKGDQIKVKVQADGECYLYRIEDGKESKGFKSYDNMSASDLANISGLEVPKKGKSL